MSTTEQPSVPEREEPEHQPDEEQVESDDEARRPYDADQDERDDESREARRRFGRGK